MRSICEVADLLFAHMNSSYRKLLRGYPKSSPGVNGLASSSSQETQIWATQKRPFWGVSLDNNNFRLKHLNRPARKFNILITPLKPKFYSKTFSFNLFNISKAERVHMNCFMRLIILCQIVKLHPDLVSLLFFWFLFFVDFFGPFLWLTERKDLFAMKLHSVKWSGCSGWLVRKMVWVPRNMVGLFQVRVPRNMVGLLFLGLFCGLLFLGLPWN